MLRRALARFWMPRLAAGSLPSWLAQRLHTAVRTDPQLARAYDALRRAERTSSGGDHALTGGQRDLLEALVLGGAMEAAPVGAAPRFALPGFAGALAAAAVLAFVVVRAPVGDTYPLGGLAARGEALKTAPLGVKVTCVEASDARGGARRSATAGARQTGGVLSCPRSSMLAFSMTNLGTDSRHIFIVGVGAGGERRWYAPFTKDGAAIEVAPHEVDRMLNTLADTTTMAADKTVSLFVLMSDAPFNAASVERQLASSAQRGVPLQNLERLPLVDVPLQARIDLEWTP